MSATERHLKRFDDHFASILFSSQHATLYIMEESPEGDTSEDDGDIGWTKMGIDGPFYIIQRDQSPDFRIVVFNRHDDKIFDMFITSKDGSHPFAFEGKDEFILFNSNGVTRAFWLSDKKDISKFTSTLNKILSRSIEKVSQDVEINEVEVVKSNVHIQSNGHSSEVEVAPPLNQQSSNSNKNQPQQKTPSKKQLRASKRQQQNPQSPQILQNPQNQPSLTMENRPTQIQDGDQSQIQPPMAKQPQIPLPMGSQITPPIHMQSQITPPMESMVTPPMDPQTLSSMTKHLSNSSGHNSFINPMANHPSQSFSGQHQPHINSMANHPPNPLHHSGQFPIIPQNTLFQNAPTHQNVLNQLPPPFMLRNSGHIPSPPNLQNQQNCTNDNLTHHNFNVQQQYPSQGSHMPLQPPFSKMPLQHQDSSTTPQHPYMYNPYQFPYFPFPPQLNPFQPNGVNHRKETQSPLIHSSDELEQDQSNNVHPKKIIPKQQLSKPQQQQPQPRNLQKKQEFNIEDLFIKTDKNDKEKKVKTNLIRKQEKKLEQHNQNNNITYSQQKQKKRQDYYIQNGPLANDHEEDEEEEEDNIDYDQEILTALRTILKSQRKKPSITKQQLKIALKSLLSDDYFIDQLHERIKQRNM